ncbi:Alpha/Beta hydrolase protein [Trametes punicea]|nr:Alpha/Beta hydrolase protein [Trametes punicea]
MSSDSPLSVVQDSGIPESSSDYTTLVIVHGYAWHSGIFSKLIPLARKYNARIVLVNRRDYPGSQPLTTAERALLLSSASETTDNQTAIPSALENMKIFMRDRARELYDFLVGLTKSGNVASPDAENNKGGIILAGWSFGTGLITAFLANVASFPVGEIKLSDYVRRVVFLDPPFHVLGYPMPENPYNPLFDSEIPTEERGKAFTNWVSGYYFHGDTLDTLERRTSLVDPRPTLSTLTPEDISHALFLPPAAPGGSDEILLQTGIKVGLYEALRKEAFYTSAGNKHLDEDRWRDVEVRYVSCERSVWEMPWGTMNLEKELEFARTQGLPMRNVQLVFVKDANHFVQWDKPEHALRALVENEELIE